ncbi:hypothetical protein PanWU01x14_038320 [Parasponia andersonii]|uniref:Uncharacterized protein n=1 Tax=Parasponia andersonii TaxID=3476 RepID=A0A2P5DRH9_PARAD|nr:hypothetical protein PanWU01x14_038320 [Parasponia andersonii]
MIIEESVGQPNRTENEPSRLGKAQRSPDSSRPNRRNILRERKGNSVMTVESHTCATKALPSSLALPRTLAFFASLGLELRFS